MQGVFCYTCVVGQWPEDGPFCLKMEKDQKQFIYAAGVMLLSLTIVVWVAVKATWN